MSNPTTPRIILDTDPGIDDAIAIITAARWSEIVGITTVAGNVPVDHTTVNALKISELIGLDVPIHKGANEPLVSEPLHARHVHGTTGLGEVNLPEPKKGPDSEDAVSFLIETTREEEGLHLVPIGPLTNIALALDKDPEIVNRVASITLMGGGVGIGNVTAAAEFNIFADVEAADLVFRSGAPLSMVGLNLTHQVRMNSEHVAACRKLETNAGNVIGDLLDFNIQLHQNSSRPISGAMHDPCAVLSVTHPQLFHFEPRPVNIELCGTHTRGQTLVDERHLPESKSNCQVGYQVSTNKVLELIIEAIAIA